MKEADNFQENVKNSFKKAREDILKLQNSLKELKHEIRQLKPPPPQESSIGNKGVFNKQTNKQTHQQTDKSTLFQHSTTLNKLNEDIEAHFNSLTRQELLVFLSLYQLEDEIHTVRFLDLAHYLKLSESSIRGYINRLLDKGSPIIRKRINNKVINLSLSPDFRTLNLKNKLSELYYQSDTSQKRIFDPY